MTFFALSLSLSPSLFITFDFCAFIVSFPRGPRLKQTFLIWIFHGQHFYLRTRINGCPKIFKTIKRNVLHSVAVRWESTHGIREARQVVKWGLTYWLNARVKWKNEFLPIYEYSSIGSISVRERNLSQSILLFWRFLLYFTFAETTWHPSNLFLPLKFSSHKLSSVLVSASEIL